MVMPHRRPSAAMRSIHRELERRRPKPLAPKRPVANKSSVPPPPPPSRDGAHGKVHKPCPRPVHGNPSSYISMAARSGSTGTNPPPPSRPRHQPLPPCASPAVSPLPPPPPSPSARSSAVSESAPNLCAAAHQKLAASPLFASPAPLATPPRAAASSIGSTCVAAPSTSCHLKPGTTALVRTRTQTVIDGKILVLWLGATVVSATDCSYEVIYEGNLPRDNPFSTVHVPLHHVRPFNPSPPTAPPRPSQLRSAAASSSTSATSTQAAASKSLEMLPAPRLTADGMKLQSADENLLEKPSLQIPLPPRVANPTLVAVSKTSKMRSAMSKSTPAGKIDGLIHSRPTKMKPTPAGKSLRLISSLSPEMKKPVPRPTTAGKSISVIRRLLPEKERLVLDAYIASRQLPLE